MKPGISKYLLLSHVRQLSIDTGELKLDGAESITNNLALWLAAQFAFVARAVGERNEEGCVDIKTLRNLNAGVIALPRSDLAAERLKFDREKYEFSAIKAAIQHAKKIKWIISDKPQGVDDRIERVRRLLFGEDNRRVNPPEPGACDKPGESRSLNDEQKLKEGRK
jgi:hypothetical protein